ncbi:C40 family peptidase [Methylopila sp. Yamaguchi]|uniref:C40 family peptidase n=1 Tax=Methylopila sp. Yamaguchi TaxID=1437817 RepID=UPI000CAD87E2|nr:NlpC/P60 family protein [Methylopila sp. Yamaguchi]GBD49949.1 NLP/P60 protein [Methylopila sp. Yamaguchi]
MKTPLDRRLTPARPDVAAAHLKGRVEALRFVEGDRRRVAVGHAGLRRAPNPLASLETEALFGEEVVVYDELEGWAWVQLALDGYVGYMPAAALSADLGPGATHRVAALRTLLFPEPSIKTPPADALSMGAKVSVADLDGRFAVLDTGAYAIAAHLAPVDVFESDPAAVAERFVGAPYLWGGRTSLGLDCSGLVQISLAACGIAAPRDADMQEGALGEAVALSDVRRNDLLFWKGHVALVRDKDTIVHANGHAMAVTLEPLQAAIARIAAGGDPVTSIKRI